MQWFATGLADPWNQLMLLFTSAAEPKERHPMTVSIS